jgi:phage terminase large subunit-like protein
MAVRATRGKAVRAEPIAALYEQGKVHHVGELRDLETQMITWSPAEDESPDRVDAMVWAITAMMNKQETQIIEDQFANW